MANVVSRCEENTSCNIHTTVQPVSHPARTDAGVTLLELLAAVVLSVSALATIGLVFQAQTASWNHTVRSEQLQSDLDTVNAALTTAFQNMSQAQVRSGGKEVQGSHSGGTLWDIRVTGQDIVITKTSSSKLKTSKTLHFADVSLANSTFAPSPNTTSGNGTTAATKLVDTMLRAQWTGANENRIEQSELDVTYAVGSGF